MSNVILRQNDLFIGEDWQVIYTAFSNINFKNYSFDSIKKSLIDYIRINYPEDFTDWSENSEFMMIVDMLAYLAETLSFRIDLNARDNFIDTAERRESILRLAKMVSYTPKRNYPSRGKVKIRSVKTSQIVLDSEGRNLQNRPILWNDSQNPDWYEQFMLVMNSTLVSTNPFGKPVKAVQSGSKNIQLYQMNSVPRSDLVLPFTASVAGETMNFEIVNPDVDEFGNFFERHPNPDQPKFMIYSNDGSGNMSPNTGFFMYFKQGTLTYENYYFENPIENRVVDVDVPNINELDVWVSRINENGALIDEWDKVPTVESIVYNSIDRDVRNIFAVNSRDDDKIAIRFADGRFGTAPKGLFRVWWRESNGLEYTINPREMGGRTVIFSYNSNNGIDRDSSYDLTVTFDLFDNIRNSATSETSELIKERAPRVYYSQNRMANGEDYNSFPLSYGPQITMLKAVNRVYSGQSPFFDNYDPTKRYSSTIDFGDDGIVYKEDYSRTMFEVLPTDKTPNQIIQSNIIPLLMANDLDSFFLDRNQPTDINLPPVPTAAQGGWVWNMVSGQVSTSTGYMSLVQGGQSIMLSPTEPTPANMFRSSAYVLFEEPKPFDTNTGQYNTTFEPARKWANIISVNSLGTYDPVMANGPVMVDEFIPNGWIARKIIPAFRQTLTPSEMDAIATHIFNRNTFGLRFDIFSQTWRVIDELNVAPVGSTYSPQFTGDNSDTNRDASWLIRVQYSANEYSFVSRNLKYIFESKDITRFYFNNEIPGVNQTLNNVGKSLISILSLNKNIRTGNLFKNDLIFKITDSIRYADGFIEPRRVQIIPNDTDSDGTRDTPDLFNYLLGNPSSISSIIFHKRELDVAGFESFVPTNTVLAANTFAQLTQYDWGTNSMGYEAGWAMNTRLFYVWDTTTKALVVDYTGKFRYAVGRGDLNFKHQHLSPENNRIDPAITNIIDTYVLTNAYYKSVIEWKNSNRSLPFPEPELPIVLQDTFKELETYKMISDQMIWNPAVFRKLFGNEAELEQQALFKVVKIENSLLTDNQIKQGVLDAIEEYFDLENWTFGESIFTSELISYIHLKMINHVASVVVVPKQKNEFGVRHPGDIYQIRMDFNELPLSTATVDNIIIVPSASKANITN